jgi:hypothetical protein
VVSGGGQDVYQHLGTQGSHARCKTLRNSLKNQRVPTLQFFAEWHGNFSSFAIART